MARGYREMGHLENGGGYVGDLHGRWGENSSDPRVVDSRAVGGELGATGVMGTQGGAICAIWHALVLCEHKVCV